MSSLEIIDVKRYVIFLSFCYWINSKEWLVLWKYKIFLDKSNWKIN